MILFGMILFLSDLWISTPLIAYTLIRILDIIKNVWKTQGRSQQTVTLSSFSKAKIGGDDLDEKLV